MTQFIAFENNVEVKGRAVLSMLEGMEPFRDKALQVLEKHGILSPKKEEWYSQQYWLNAFKEIADKVGHFTLYCIGTKIHENAQFPTNIDSLESALMSIDTAYHMNHRGGKIGGYKFIKSEDGSMHFICNNPYPCEFDRGIIEGIARKFIHAEQHLFVRHDDSAPCRIKGGDSCTYHIQITKK